MVIEISKHRKFSTLRRIDKKPRSKVYLIIDIESKISKPKLGKKLHTPFLICYALLKLNSDGTHEKLKTDYVETKEEVYSLFASLNQEYHDLYMLSHNSSYDFGTLDIFTFFAQYEYKCLVYNPAKGAFFIKFQKSGMKLTIIDNMNFFEGSVEDLGKELGFRKGKMPKSTKLTKAFIKYCKRDVDIVVKGLIELSKICGKYGYGELEITRAKLCFNIFSSKFLNTFIQTHNNKLILEREFDSYAGGRVEAFYQGQLPKADYYYLDVNSLYPYIMLTSQVSTRVRNHFTNAKKEWLEDKLKRYNALAKVTITIEKPCAFVRTDTKLLFPVGTFTGTYCGNELKYILKHAKKVKIHYGYLYLAEFVFTEYVKHFHALKTKYKKENKPIFAYFAKLMLNSLYGKFVQRTPTIQATGYKSDSRYETRLVLDYGKGRKFRRRIINYEEYDESDRQVMPNTVPILGSEITSNARSLMWSFIEKAELKNVFYTDTDSLIVNQAGYDKLKCEIKNGVLGALELEAKSQHCKINTLKDYEFGEKITRKSVSKKAKQINKNTFEYEYFSTLTELVSNSIHQVFFTEKRRKTLQRIISKGLKDKNNRVNAWRLG